MVSKNTIAFLILLPLMFEVAQSLAQPSDSPDRGVAPDFSYSRGNLEVSAPNPSALGRRTLRGGASLAVNKNQAPSPADACNPQPHALGPCHGISFASIDYSMLLEPYNCLTHQVYKKIVIYDFFTFL